MLINYLDETAGCQQQQVSITVVYICVNYIHVIRSCLISDHELQETTAAGGITNQHSGKEENSPADAQMLVSH